VDFTVFASGLWRVQPLPFNALPAVSSFVRDPIFVDFFVNFGQYSVQLPSLVEHMCVGLHRLQNVDAFGQRQLPRPSTHTVWPIGQGADGAEVDNVAREFLVDVLLDLRVDLAGIPSAQHAEVVTAALLVAESNAASALNAAVHVHLHEWTDFFVFHSSLLLREPAELESLQSRLILQVAFAALVADGAVKRMVGQNVLHDVPAHDSSLFALGEDLHAFHDFGNAADGGQAAG